MNEQRCHVKCTGTNYYMFACNSRVCKNNDEKECDNCMRYSNCHYCDFNAGVTESGEVICELEQ